MRQVINLIAVDMLWIECTPSPDYTLFNCYENPKKPLLIDIQSEKVQLQRAYNEQIYMKAVTRWKREPVYVSRPMFDTFVWEVNI